MLHDLLSLKNDGAGTPYWHAQVAAGFPAASLWTLANALDVEHTDIVELVGLDPQKVAWSRRGEKLSPGVSNTLLRIAMAYHRLYATLKDEEAVIAWLRNPQKVLDGLTPIRLLTTDPGTAAVLAAVAEVVAPKEKVAKDQHAEDSNRIRTIDDAEEESASSAEEDEVAPLDERML